MSDQGPGTPTTYPKFNFLVPPLGLYVISILSCEHMCAQIANICLTRKLQYVRGTKVGTSHMAEFCKTCRPGHQVASAGHRPEHTPFGSTLKSRMSARSHATLSLPPIIKHRMYQKRVLHEYGARERTHRFLSISSSSKGPCSQRRREIACSARAVKGFTM